MNHIINAALQILPKGDKKTYDLVDSAIEIIQESGLKYKVCPFETVIEGTYDEVMNVIRKAQQACIASGAKEYIAYIKLQVKHNTDVRIEDKIEKYETKNPAD